MPLPFISIIIPSRDSERTIGKLLDSLFSMNYPKRKYEIIVVDSSIDKTPQVVKKYPVKLIRITRTKERNIALACNTGIKASKGKFVAFIDSDCVVGKNWLNDLLNSSSKEIACVGGKVITSGNIFDKYAQSAYKSPMRNIDKKYITNLSNFHKRMWPVGSNFMIRKDVIKEVGYFDEKLQFYEEVDLFWRVCQKGYKLLLVPRARAKHSYRRSFFGMFKTYLRYGMGCGYFCKRHINSKFGKLRLLLMLSILGFYSFLLITISLFFTHTLSSYFLLIPLAIYLCLISYYISKKNREFSLVFPLLDFIFCGIAYIIGMTYSLIKPVKSP